MWELEEALLFWNKCLPAEFERFKECDRDPEIGWDAGITWAADKGRCSVLQGNWAEMERGQLTERFMGPIDDRERKYSKVIVLKLLTVLGLYKITIRP